MDEPCTNRIRPAGPVGSPACLFHRNSRTPPSLLVQCSVPVMCNRSLMPATPVSEGGMTFLRIVIRSNLFVEHDLFRKPVSTFRDHALGRKRETLPPVWSRSARTHSGLMPFALITFAHFSISDFT